MKFEEQNAREIKRCEQSFIYFLLKDEQVVYVGKTSKGLSRPFSHNDKDFNKVMVIDVNYDELDKWEDFYIKKYMPFYNKVVNYTMNYSLQRAKSEIKETLTPYFNLAKLKKIIRILDIHLFLFNGVTYIEKCDFDRVYEYVRSEVE